ncbi:hypothetical protein C5689_06680 [Methylosinus sporium]|uniref:Uncharacterized protein n=1 Tax=Methylosinus sporium TaxID=428 RepID=A0A2U1ST00_METSR|nr:hypothetical protein C5689_06680 [Methylosinus sporium]
MRLRSLSQTRGESEARLRATTREAGSNLRRGASRGAGRHRAYAFNMGFTRLPPLTAATSANVSAMPSSLASQPSGTSRTAPRAALVVMAA